MHRENKSIACSKRYPLLNSQILQSSYVLAMKTTRRPQPLRQKLQCIYKKLIPRHSSAAAANMLKAWQWSKHHWDSQHTGGTGVNAFSTLEHLIICTWGTYKKETHLMLFSPAAFLLLLLSSNPQRLQIWHGSRKHHGISQELLKYGSIMFHLSRFNVLTGNRKQRLNIRDFKHASFYFGEWE